MKKLTNRKFVTYWLTLFFSSPTESSCFVISVWIIFSLLGWHYRTTTESRNKMYVAVCDRNWQHFSALNMKAGVCVSSLKWKCGGGLCCQELGSGFLEVCTKGLARPILQFIFLEAGFRSRPVLGRLRLLVKENIIFEFFKTDYNLSNIRLTHVPVYIYIYISFFYFQPT